MQGLRFCSRSRTRTSNPWPKPSNATAHTTTGSKMNKHETDCMAILLRALDEGRIFSVVLKPREVVVCRHGSLDRHPGNTFADALAQAAQVLISEDEDHAYQVVREEQSFIDDVEAALREGCRGG